MNAGPVREALIDKMSNIVTRLQHLKDSDWHPYEEPYVRIMSTELVFREEGLKLKVDLRNGGAKMTVISVPLNLPFPAERSLWRNWPREDILLPEGPLRDTTSMIWGNFWKPRDDAEKAVVTEIPQKIRNAL